MYSIKHFSSLITCFLLSVFLSACGAKGDLYQIPEPTPEQKIKIKEALKKNKDIQKKST